MKKSFITALIVLICVALVGLIAIQIYWIQNSIALRDTQFRYNVKIAITEFNHVLEKEEQRERLRILNMNRKAALDLDSIIKSRPKASVYVTNEDVGGDTALYITPDGEFTFKFSNHKTTTRIWDPFNASDASSSDIEPPTSRISQEQSELFSELLAGLIQLEMDNDFINRYSAGSLDTLIRRNLNEVGGISARYHFGIFDVYDQPIIMANEASGQMNELLKEGYRSRLFPNDNSQEPIYLRIWFPDQDSYLLKTLWPLLFASAIFMLTVIFAFGYSIRTILYQKKLSAIKNDFINNMTHELKTPISTISLACEALSDPAMSKSEVRTGQFLKMIRDENKRLGVLVENVLRSAVLDRGEMRLSRDKVDFHEVILAAIRNIELQAQQKGGQIVTDLLANSPIIKGDKVHLTNVIYNLLDNAIKYSQENLKIKVSTSSNESYLQVCIEDNGIGIKKEDQARIFEKLFRVHTGNVHDIKGFGLGLSYVKMIVEKHHGTVSVRSDYGKGSTFIIQLPFDYDI